MATQRGFALVPDFYERCFKQVQSYYGDGKEEGVEEGVEGQSKNKASEILLGNSQLKEEEKGKEKETVSGNGFILMD